MSKRKAVILIVLSLAVVAAAIAVMAPDQREQSSAQATTAATTGDKRWQAVAPGRVEPRSGTIRIATPVVGLVGHVLVKPNDTVFAGEPLIQLRDDELRARLMAAEALAAARWRARNDQSASGKADQRRKAEDAVAYAERSVFDAQAAVDRAAAKWRAGGEPDASLTAARSELARAQNDLAARQAQLRKTSSDDPIPTALDAQFTAARADVAVARAALEKMILRAPADGTVLQVNIKAGELTAPSALQPLLLLANLSVLRVRAEVDERDVAGIKAGQSASVRAAAFPGREFAGRVSSIAPLVEPAHLDSRGQANRSDVDVVEVLIDLAQPGPLAVGMKVDVYFGQENPSAK